MQKYNNFFGAYTKNAKKCVFQHALHPKHPFLGPNPPSEKPQGWADLSGKKKLSQDFGKANMTPWRSHRIFFKVIPNSDPFQAVMP